MALDGIRKAAALLMSLDPGTASELLKSASPDVIKQIATELAYLQTSGQEKQDLPTDLMAEFCALLGKDGPQLWQEDSVQKLLEDTVGQQQSQEIMVQVQDLVRARAPFMSIRSADARDLAGALEGESPQAIAAVLSELPSSKTRELLSLLPEEGRVDVLCGMTSPESASVQAKLRIAGVVLDRLRSLEQSQGGQGGREPPDAKLRKVAVLLRGMEPAQRDPLLASIVEKDQPTGDAVQGLMVTWEDITIVADRSPQGALRSADSRKMALSMFGADEAVSAKFRANISDRASTMLDEELSLLSAPKPDEVRDARESILQVLRDMNSKGELSFEEG